MMFVVFFLDYSGFSVLGHNSDINLPSGSSTFVPDYMNPSTSTQYNFLQNLPGND